jgi:steroid delta-isomerase-like uncharacterized protein
MSVQENVELMRRWFKEVWNEGKTQTIHNLMAPDGIGIGEHEDGTPLRGPSEFVPFVERIRGAFPDINVVVEDAFGAEDKVVVRWSATMTHRGDHLGMPASGKPVRMTGITIARIREKQIIEGWDNWDQLGMLKQIGAYGNPQTGLLKAHSQELGRSICGVGVFCGSSASVGIIVAEWLFLSRCAAFARKSSN